MTTTTDRLTAAQHAQLLALDNAEPDTSDSPPAPEANWHAVPGLSARRDLYRARKEPISLRLDRDVLDWLRAQGPGYQTTINRILRDRMEADAT